MLYETFKLDSKSVTTVPIIIVYCSLSLQKSVSLVCFLSSLRIQLMNDHFGELLIIIIIKNMYYYDNIINKIVHHQPIANILFNQCQLLLTLQWSLLSANEKNLYQIPILCLSIINQAHYLTAAFVCPIQERTKLLFRRTL